MAIKSYLGEFEQMVLLAVLRCGEQAFGLEVRREIEERADRRVTRGAFYTTLDRLVTKGFLRWSEETPPEARSAQLLRRYHLTDEGLEAVRAARRAMAALSSGLDEILEGA